MGKTTVVQGLEAVHPFHFSVSATTRPPRRGERHEVDYIFLSRRRFDEWLAADRFLEWAEYGGHRYGTPDAVLSVLAAGGDVLLDIENHGAMQVKDAYPDAITVFLAPPSMSELERRLRSRGDTDEEAIGRRLAVADEQIQHAGIHYDHVVTNGDVGEVVEEIRRILLDDSHEQHTIH